MEPIDRLYDLIDAAATDPDGRLLDRVLAAAMEISGAERGFVVLVDGSVEVRASRNLDGEEVRAAESKISRTVLQRVLASDRPLVLRDGELTSTSLRGQQVRAVCALPLRSRAGAIGAVYLDRRLEGSAFPGRDLRLLAAIGAQAAVAIERARLRAPSRPACGPRRPAALLGDSAAMKGMLRLVGKFAPLPYPVLLQGESGTGKELVARALHERGPRAGRPFLAANVAAIAPALFESEMFGHVRGSFTGADRDREGLFEQAEGGTLFLDEINSLAAGLQEKLLRVLQEREIRRVGGTRTIPVDVRLVAASNTDLERTGFRRDLFHRLNVLRIDLPPLRERPEDIPALAGRFLDDVEAETSRRFAFGPGATERLARHDWPGNVRELENAVRRAAALAEGGVLGAGDFDFLAPRAAGSAPVLSVDDYLRDAIARWGASMPQEELAARLGVSRKTLWSLRRKFGIA